MWRAGGANVPALNDLLAPYGVAFGDAILEGQVQLEPEKPYYASGANIVRFPAEGHLHSWALADKATEGKLSACSGMASLCGNWVLKKTEPSLQEIVG